MVSPVVRGMLGIEAVGRRPVADLRAAAPGGLGPGGRAQRGRGRRAASTCSLAREPGRADDRGGSSRDGRMPRVRATHAVPGSRSPPPSRSSPRALRYGDGWMSRSSCTAVATCDAPDQLDPNDGAFVVDPSQSHRTSAPVPSRPPDHVRVVFSYDEGTEVYAPIEPPARGAATEGLRILRSRAEDGTAAPDRRGPWRPHLCARRPFTAGRGRRAGREGQAVLVRHGPRAGAGRRNRGRRPGPIGSRWQDRAIR